MDFDQACLELTNLAMHSTGSPLVLASGRSLAFKITRKYSDIELQLFERDWGIRLPRSYCVFLQTVGAGEYFVNEYGLGVHFHELQNIQAYSDEVFLGRTNPFPRLLLVVSLSGRGDEGGYDLRTNEDRFTVFSGEEDPEDWLSDEQSWCDFSSWFTRLIASDGENDLP